MLVPNAHRATVDIRKLRDYCLNPHHEDGKHKARLFLAALGMTSDAAEELRSVLIQIVRTHEADPGLRDEFGQRYQIDFMLDWRGRKAMIRSGWIIEHDSDRPKLTTCFPL